MSLERWANQILTSIRGSRLGLDHRDFLVGPAGERSPQEIVTAGSTLSPGGTSILETTAAASYDLVAPSESMRGVRKRIVSNSTAAHAVRTGSTEIFLASNALSTYHVLTLTGVGEAVDLEYISTSVIAVMGSTANITSLATST